MLIDGRLEVCRIVASIKLIGIETAFLPDQFERGLGGNIAVVREIGFEESIVDALEGFVAQVGGSLGNQVRRNAVGGWTVVALPRSKFAAWFVLSNS